MSEKKNTRKSGTKEIILFIILVLIVELVGYLRNDENYAVGEDVTNASSISFNMESIPQYTDMPYVSIDNNKPAFTESDYTTKPFETYSELDSLGRCRSSVCKYLQRDNASRWRRKTSNKYD